MAKKKKDLAGSLLDGIVKQGKKIIGPTNMNAAKRAYDAATAPRANTPQAAAANGSGGGRAKPATKTPATKTPAKKKPATKKQTNPLDRMVVADRGGRWDGGKWRPYSDVLHPKAYAKRLANLHNREVSRLERAQAGIDHRREQAAMTPEQRAEAQRAKDADMADIYNRNLPHAKANATKAATQLDELMTGGADLTQVNRETDATRQRLDAQRQQALAGAADDAERQAINAEYDATTEQRIDGVISSNADRLQQTRQATAAQVDAGTAPNLQEIQQAQGKAVSTANVLDRIQNAKTFLEQRQANPTAQQPQQAEPASSMDRAQAALDRLKEQTTARRPMRDQQTALANQAADAGRTIGEQTQANEARAREDRQVKLQQAREQITRDHEIAIAKIDAQGKAGVGFREAARATSEQLRDVRFEIARQDELVTQLRDPANTMDPATKQRELEAAQSRLAELQAEQERLRKRIEGLVPDILDPNKDTDD
jgi:hypothetical protein